METTEPISETTEASSESTTKPAQWSQQAVNLSNGPQPKLIGTVVRPRFVHEQEAMAATTKALGAVPNVDRDESRNMWRAWIGDTDFERAKVRGEWTTPLGALRRLRNHSPTMQQEIPTPSAVPSRPEPAGGSMSAYDALERRQRERKAGFRGAVRNTVSFGAYLLAAFVVAVVAWEGFLRRAMATQNEAPPAPAAVTPARAPEPAEEWYPPVAPVVPGPVVHRRRLP